MAQERHKIDWRLFEFSLEELGMINRVDARAMASSSEDHDDAAGQHREGSDNAKRLC